MPVIAKFRNDFGEIRVTRDASDGTLAYYQGGSFHSQSTPNGVSICAYVHLIYEAIVQSRARRVLIIGCAGGNLATMLSRRGCKVTIVDINPLAFDIAHRFFAMPRDIRCILRDGLAALRAVRQPYDVIVIDVFGGDNHIPRKFTRPPFFKLARSKLTLRGLFVMNVITADDKDRQASVLARRVQNAGFDVTLLDWPGETDRNSLIMGNLTRHARLPSGDEPDFVADDFEGLIRRRLRFLR